MFIFKNTRVGLVERKIIIGVIVAVALIIGILSVVFSANLSSNQKTGNNNTVSNSIVNNSSSTVNNNTVNNNSGSISTAIAPPAPTSGHHYGIVLNETTIVTAHP